MFKSKIEVREYAVNKAIELMGTGTPTKQVVDKAKEIENYVMGDAVLPETVDENEVMNSILEVLTGVAIGLINPGYRDCNTALTGMALKEDANKPEKTE